MKISIGKPGLRTSISISDEAIKKEKIRDKFIEKYKGLADGIEEALGNVYDSFHPKKTEKAEKVEK